MSREGIIVERVFRTYYKDEGKGGFNRDMMNGHGLDEKSDSIHGSLVWTINLLLGWE